MSSQSKPSTKRMLDRRRFLKAAATGGVGALAGAVAMGALDRTVFAAAPTDFGQSYDAGYGAEQGYDMLVFTDGTYYYVKDGWTGQLVVYQSKLTAWGATLTGGTTGTSTTTGGFAEAVSALPSITFQPPGAQATPGTIVGHQGRIFVKNGRYTFTTQYLFPAGMMDVIGESGNPFQVAVAYQSAGTPLPYLGGVEFYFTGTTYPVCQVPLLTGTGGSSGTWPTACTQLNLKNIAFIIAHPSSTQANGIYAFDFSGVMHCSWDVVNFYDDQAYRSLVPQTIQGFYCNPGGGADCWDWGTVHVAGFMCPGVYFANIGPVIENLEVGDIQGQASGGNTYALFINAGAMINHLHLINFWNGILYWGGRITIKALSFESQNSSYNIPFAQGGSTALAIDMIDGIGNLTGGGSYPGTNWGYAQYATINRTYPAIPPFSQTAGTSPSEVGGFWPFNAIFVITTVGGLSAVTLDSESILGSSFSAGEAFFVPGGSHNLTVTWSGTAPVFEIIPIV